MLAIGALAIALGIWLRALEAGNRVRMGRRIEELRSPRPQCGARVRIPLGDPLRGDAWIHYRKALATAVLAGDEEPKIRTCTLQGIENDDRLRSILSAHRESFEALARGVRSTDLGAVPRQSDREYSAELEAYNDLSLLVRARAMLLSREGEPRRAMETVLHFARMLMDRELSGRADRTSAQGWSELEEPLRLLVALFRWSAMNPDEWSDLEKKLELLDRGFPCYLKYFEQGLASVGEKFQDETYSMRLDVGVGSDERSWRYAFSTSLMRQAAFFHYDDELRQVAAGHEGSGSEFDSTCQALRELDWSSKNPILQSYHLIQIAPNPAARRIHSQIRLLRAAAAWAARGEVLELADPLGTTLLRKTDGRHLTIANAEATEVEVTR